MEFDSLKNENNLEIQKKAIKKETANNKEAAFILFGKGTSMWPTLLEKDALYFKRKITFAKLQVGDIIAYTDKNDKIICHRIFELGKACLWTIGDLSYLRFSPKIEDCEKVPFEKVIGILIFVRRKNKILKTFPNGNKNQTFFVKLKFKLMDCYIKINYHKAHFIRNVFAPPLMIILNKNTCVKNIRKANFENYTFVETKLEDSKIELKVYNKEQHVNTLYYEIDKNLAKIYKMSVKMLNFGKGTELLGLKYLETKGLIPTFDLSPNNLVSKYFNKGISAKINS